MSKKKLKLPQDKVQGEGDYKSAKKFDEAEQGFVKSGGIEKAAGKAEPKSAEEAEELKHAEQIGRSHSKGDDAGMSEQSVEADGQG
jgi:hypothetical protein